MEKEVKKDCCCGHCNHAENIKEEKHECNCGDNCTCGEHCECGDNCHCNDVDDNFDESEEVLILKNNIENLEEKLKASTAELINYRKRNHFV